MPEQACALAAEAEEVPTAAVFCFNVHATQPSEAEERR